MRTAVSGTGCSSSSGPSAGSGRQAYVVLPVIEESERADLRAATTMVQSLAARWPELRGRPGAWPAQGRGAGRRDAPVPGRRDPRAGGDDGHRGGNRRAQRHHHGDRASRAVRPGAAAPAAGADRARRGGELLHSYGRRARSPTGCRRSRPRRTASRSRSWTWRSAEWAT